MDVERYVMGLPAFMKADMRRAFLAGRAAGLEEAARRLDDKSREFDTASSHAGAFIAASNIIKQIR